MVNRSVAFIIDIYSKLNTLTIVSGKLTRVFSDYTYICMYTYISTARLD